MDELHREVKRAREVRCAVVDEVVLAPDKRSSIIYSKLAESAINTGDFSSWDLICFCTLYLSSQLAVVPDFKKEVESIAYKLYEAHYFHGGDFGLYDENFILARFRERASEIKSGESKDDSNTQKSS